LPKLFRRCTDYLKAREAGFAGLLPEGLVAASASGRRPENDLVLIGGKTEVALSTVVQHLTASASPPTSSTSSSSKSRSHPPPAQSPPSHRHAIDAKTAACASPHPPPRAADAAARGRPDPRYRALKMRAR